MKIFAAIVLLLWVAVFAQLASSSHTTKGLLPVSAVLSSVALALTTLL